ncbi:FliM/FliN family flagellar motor switch protein, partial [Amnibacterium sp.]|uniref:FliM/FliN family flagellar motor switch protein n=1 Tax=Amnibacterium sp. TaxID=1872496 RepID=UPI002613BCEC
LAEARFWASRLVGGSGAASGEERLLTPVERALVWHLVDEHAVELHLAFDGLLPPLVVEAFAYDRVGELAAPDDLMVQAGFALDRDGIRVVLTVTVPAEPLLEALGHGTARQDQAVVSRRLEQHVADAPVEIALRFDDTRVGASVVLTLAEGDLIPLDHPRHQPLAITMDGFPVVRAAVGGNGDRLACVVVDA